VGADVAFVTGDKNFHDNSNRVSYALGYGPRRLA
jgi:hypothetical protein